MNAKIDPKLLDLLAKLEVDALLEGLQDPEMRRNPSFLEKVRKFLKENQLRTSPETPGVKKIQQSAEDIPIFDDLEPMN
ncbi:hypothetical protein [Propionispora hippei]|jgi:hypothetical protein|uniref:Uncharacterized protein n=1 Tax=Propionispora hippei DSM 15287 TaxID=1123003 RepID=A0A1M6NKZ9_9FIRM|nr:hypothetical protein [Propionispora hippei]SHJ96425.1 hypothetical protein SAMN02745170_03795 [Propionispora hippei DSM 15287]